MCISGKMVMQQLDVNYYWVCSVSVQVGWVRILRYFASTLGRSKYVLADTQSVL